MARLVVVMALLAGLFGLIWADATSAQMESMVVANLVEVDNLMWAVGPTPKRNRRRGGMGMRAYRRWSRWYTKKAAAAKAARLARPLPELTLKRKAREAFWAPIRKAQMRAVRKARLARKAERKARREAEARAARLREEARLQRVMEMRARKEAARKARREAREAGRRFDAWFLPASTEARKQEMARLRADILQRAAEKAREEARQVVHKEVDVEKTLWAWWKAHKLGSRKTQRFLVARGWVTQEQINSFIEARMKELGLNKKRAHFRQERRKLLKAARMLHKKVGGFIPTYVYISNEEAFVTSSNIPGSIPLHKQVSIIDKALECEELLRLIRAVEVTV